MFEEVWDNIQRFPWGTRVSMFLIFTATLIYARASMLELINKAWKVMYIFRFGVFAISSIYIVLLITGVIGPNDYATATQWLLPLILFGSNWLPFLHIWEEHDVKEETKGAMGGSNFSNTGSRYLKRALRSGVQPAQSARRSELYVGRSSGNREQDVSGSSGETRRSAPIV